jgi:two-component system alkaline phosphatase synthesis response regulator PhoP
VLVVDDDHFTRQFIRDALEDDGYELIIATSGSEALERARTDHPDLLLLDIMMPEIDGLDVARALRADAATRDLPIVIVTAKASPTDAEAAFAAGANDYITKPFTAAVLRARTRVWLLRSASANHQGSGLGAQG